MSIYLNNLAPEISYKIGYNGNIHFFSEHGSVLMNCGKLSHSSGYGVRFWFSDRVYHEMIFKSAREIINRLSSEVNEIFKEIENKAKALSS